jgi:hypothetical protein
MARRNSILGEIGLAALSCFGAWLCCALMLGLTIDDAGLVVWLLFAGLVYLPLGVGLTVATGGLLLKSARRLQDSFFYNYSSAVWVLLLTVLMTLLVAAADARHDVWYRVLVYLHASFLAVWGYCMLSKWRGVY